MTFVQTNFEKILKIFLFFINHLKKKYLAFNKICNSAYIMMIKFELAFLMHLTASLYYN